MTNLLGSKRWIAAVAAAGALIAVSGCAASQPDDGGSASASAGTTSEATTPSAESGAPAESSPSPSSGSTGATTGATPSPYPSVSDPAPAAGGTCTAEKLTGAIEEQLGGGAAGSVYRTLVLTNASGQECTLEGYPGVSFVDASGNQIGAAADRDGSAPVGITLAAGASATATLRQTNAQNYGDDCGLTPAAGLRVYPPGATDSLVLPQEIPACSAASIVLMTVGTLQPAA